MRGLDLKACDLYESYTNITAHLQFYGCFIGVYGWFEPKFPSGYDYRLMSETINTLYEKKRVLIRGTGEFEGNTNLGCWWEHGNIYLFLELPETDIGCVLGDQALITFEIEAYRPNSVKSFYIQMII